MKSSRLVLFVLLLALLVAACAPVQDEPEAPGAPPPAAVPSESPLAGTNWILASLRGQAPAEGTAITLQFAADGTASGTDGCNRYNVSWTQSGESLTFGLGIGTLMACPEPAMTQATLYRDALASVTRFAQNSRQLILLAGNEIVLTYSADAQSPVGASWEVISYNNGREAVVSLIEGTQITLIFGESELNGTAGCNNYVGGFSIAANNIAVGEPATTMVFCAAPEGIMEQETAYLAALQSAATFSIEGNQLWLRTAADAIAVIAVRSNLVDLPAPVEPASPTGRVVGAAHLNLRAGPGTNFPILGAAREGDEGTIIGRSADGGWWVVETPQLPGGQAWVSSQFIQASNVENVPVIDSPPTPVPPPTPTLVPPTATPLPQARVSFWADRTTITAGECANLFWDVSNVQAVWVYPQGANFNNFPRTGQGNERVCPGVTTVYEMRVQLTNGATQFHHVTINVIQPIAPTATPVPPPPPVVDPLAGSRWSVVNLNNGQGAVVSVLSGTSISLEFGTGDAGRVTGNSGCNTFFSSYSAGGSTLSVSPPAGTSLFCPEPAGVMEQEQQFLAALSSAATFSIVGDQLHIRSGADALAIVASRAP